MEWNTGDNEQGWEDFSRLAAQVWHRLCYKLNHAFRPMPSIGNFRLIGFYPNLEAVCWHLGGDQVKAHHGQASRMCSNLNNPLYVLKLH
jgi:hypothetical protein